MLLCYFGVLKCFNTLKQANKPIKRAAEQRGNGDKGFEQSDKTDFSDKTRRI